VAQTGLVIALKTEAERLNKTGLFVVLFEHTGGLPAIENDTAIILYRMAQEVLNNMVKHSEAKHIHIKVILTESLFTLALSDDGKGFSVEQMQQKGSGLTNLQKRASLINARLQVTSIPGNGSHTSIELPV
jgi:signal transduction histidine kinase